MNTQPKKVENMNTFCRLNPFAALIAMALPLCAAPLLAQDKTAEEKPKIDIPARKQSIVNLEQHIKEREERQAEIAREIVRLDDRIEKMVTKIVDKVKSIKDSNESGLRVTQTKERVAIGLMEAIDYYDVTRRHLVEEMKQKSPRVEPDILAEDIKVFDERIEKRVEQIMAITNSLATHKDYSKYVGRSSGWYRTTRKNRNYTHNRQQSSRSNLDRKKVADELEKSIEDLKRLNRDLVVKLKAEGLSKEARDLIYEQRDMNDALIEHREAQFEQLVTPQSTAARAVGRNDAHNLEKLLQDAADDLDRDFNTLFGYYAELNQERQGLKKLRENLAARKAWMKNYEAENK